MKFLLCLCLFFPATAPSRAQTHAPSGKPAYQNPALSVDRRVRDLMQRMTLEEKVAMLSGSGWMESTPIERLGIPAIKMSDGPMGIRSWLGPSAVTRNLSQIATTAFPAGVAVAATWDPELAQQEGKAIGEEMRSLGRDMILGPTVNIQRLPLWGRNFEGYGEDPYLAGRIAVGYIRGVQSQGVIATVKHFVANNQEYERHRVDEMIGERALHEIYLPAFEAAVHQGHVWAVMSAYNKVNGLYCAENEPLLTGILRKDWGFKGFVISDWGSTYSTAATVNAGMDLEMPGGAAAKAWLSGPGARASGNSGFWLTPDKVLPEIRAGRIAPATVDANVSSILRVMFASGMFDRTDAPSGSVDTPAQRAVARKAATESIVLLQNNGAVLPLNLSRLHTLAVIGPSAAVARSGGGGSSLVHAPSAISPLEAIRERAGSRVKVLYAAGVPMQGDELAGGAPADRERLKSEAVKAATGADAAIVFVGYSPSLETEGSDRKSMDLPPGQDELIQAVSQANPKTIVVFNAGGPVSMDQWTRVSSILDMFYDGEEGGHAIADIVFGDATPSGKLPFTFVKNLKDSPAYKEYSGMHLKTTYSEGIYVGYRYFDKYKVSPRYPFGFGMSYTRFGYSSLKVTPSSISPNQTVDVSLILHNLGSRAGAEVVQLYVHDGHSTVDRPVKELKGFARVDLKPGESKTVHLSLDRSAFSYYSTAKHAWVEDPGKFEVLVGDSSRDIKLQGSLELTH